MKSALHLLFIVLTLLTGVSTILKADDEVPIELVPFMEPNSTLAAWRHVDLNGDGLKDYLFILNIEPREPDAAPLEERQRPLIIALRGAQGKLRVVVRNDQLVRCQTCGGIWPDPLDELIASPGTFTLAHYGGSRWRWSDSWRFDYDAKAGTWMLSIVTAGEDTANSGHLVRTYRRGQHFGAISLEGFDSGQFFLRHLRKGMPPPKPMRDDARS